MEYFVFLIYVLLIFEFWPKGGTDEAHYSYCGGRGNNTGKGMVNVIIGAVGMFLFDMFIRGKGILPDWAFWTAFIGFAIIMLSGIFLILQDFFARARE